jgi:hypothetical protein
MMTKVLASIAAILVMLSGTAQAVDHPPIKEGLWQIRTQTIDNPGGKKTDGTVSLCRDHNYDKAVEARAKDVKGCNTISESFAGSAYSSEMRCDIGSTVLVTKGTVTFLGDTSTHSETHITCTPALNGIADEMRIQDQTYEGNCPTGMQPGDRKSQDGTIGHLGGR